MRKWGAKLTVQDMKEITAFHRIILNYLKMDRLLKVSTRDDPEQKKVTNSENNSEFSCSYESKHLYSRCPDMEKGSYGGATYMGV